MGVRLSPACGVKRNRSPRWTTTFTSHIKSDAYLAVFSPSPPTTFNPPLRFGKDEEKMERDPHYIPKVGVESSSGRGKVEFVRFMDSLDEMQYAQVRDEIRMRIAAFYGVSNVFMMDAGKSGGLNNEGMQILVTNRAVESGQVVFSRIVPRLLDQMGVHRLVAHALSKRRRRRNHATSTRRARSQHRTACKHSDSNPN